MKNTIIKKVLLIFVGLVVFTFIIVESLKNGDFKVFLEAAQNVKNGISPYNVWFFVSKGNYCQYFYSPLFAIILIPFRYLPFHIVNLIWLIVNVYFLFRIWKLLSEYVDLHSLSVKKVRWIFALTLLMSLRFILYNFDMIQMTIFLLWGILESLSLFGKGKYFLGGLLLALVINIKIMPIVVLPYLLYRRETRAFFTTLLFCIIFLFLPALVLGWSKNLLYLTEWWQIVNPSNQTHLLEPGLGGHSLSAFIPYLFTKTEGTLPYSRHIFDFDLKTAILISTIFRVFLIVFSLFFLRLSTIFLKAKSKMSELWEIAYIILIIPLIFPHQQKYAFVLALPALFYISYFIVLSFNSWKEKMKILRWVLLMALLMISFILMTLTTDGLIGRNLNEIAQYYKTITIGTLILIIVLIMCETKFVESNNLSST